MLASAPRDRRAEILRAARLCFLDRGFVRTTIADVTGQCGGSRATIYTEFGSKEGLFAALIAQIGEEMRLPDLAAGAPEVVLSALGEAYLTALLESEALALYRVAMGESAHVRHLGPMLFEAGPRRAADALAERLQAWADTGLLSVSDPAQAAALFLAMVERDLHRGAVMWATTPTAEQVSAAVAFAVEMFLKATRPTSV